MKVERVPPEMVPQVWDAVGPMVQRGLRHGAGPSLEVPYVLSSILSNDMMLWVVHDAGEIIAAIVLQVYRECGRTVLYVVLIAGKRFQEWAPQVQALIQDYRALIGADVVEAMVRDGLTKWLKALGWRRKATLMELPDG